MEQQFVWLSLIIEGTIEKLLQFKMPIKSIIINFYRFNEQNSIFGHLLRLKD
jgi:hypothetical protein